MLRACIYAVLLCAFFGVASDTRAQSKNLLCGALDMSVENCALIDSVAADPPGLPWVITSQTSVAGRTSLRSGTIGDDQQSCLVLGVSLPANSVVSVAARTSSEGIFDRLLIDAGSRSLDTISAVKDQTERGWRQQGYTLQAAISELSWCYVKDGSRSRGQDAAWIDALTFISTETISVCEPLDLSAGFCAAIESVTWNPPQNRWQKMTSTGSLVGASALVTPPLAAGQSACLIIELASTLPPNNHLIFSWRITSPSEQDMLRFQAGSQQHQISNAPEWQTKYIDLDISETTLRWCYTPGNQDSRAWLDGVVLVTPADRYRVEIAITDGPVPVATQSETFRYRVEIRVESPLLPPPPDWVLLVGGIENIVEADSTFALSFGSSMSTEVVVFSTPQNPLLPATVLLALVDRPSFSGATGTSIRYTLAAREVDTLLLLVAPTVTQTAAEAPIEIAVEVRTSDRFGRPFNPQGLTLGVTAVDNANILQSSYVLSFAGGIAQTTVTVELIRDRSTGRVEISVIGGEINTTASVVINPVPPQLALITLSAASSSLVQTMPNTPVVAELILTALDNYGNPIGADNVILQLSANSGAIVQTTLTVAIEASGTTRQMVEVLPQNDLDTTLTVQLSRGTLDESVQLLPEGGIQIAVRARRVLRQLQLSLVNQVSPLRQIDRTLPIRANIHLIGLDQYDQPIAFSETTLTAAAEPSTTQVTLNPQQLSATDLQGAVTVLKVTFPETSPENTTITITIADPGTDVTVNELVVRALPDPRPNIFAVLQELNINAPNRVVQQMFGEALSIPVNVEIVPLPGDLQSLLDRFEISVFRYVLTDFSSVQEVFVDSYPLSFVNNQVQTTVVVNLSEEGQDERVRVTFLLAENFRDLGVSVQEATVTLTAAPESLGLLTVDAPEDVLQSGPDAVLSFAVTVFATGTLGSAFNPEGLSLQAVAGANTTLTEVSYALDFAGGVAQTTITVGLTRRGDVGSIELSVVSGDIQTAVSITLNPAPRILASITLSAASSSLVQTMANTAVAAELILTALDNYGNPIGADNVILQISASLDAIVASSLTVAIETSGTTRQLVEVLPQNDLDTTLTVQLSRGTLDEAVQLLPEGGIQITVRALRVLRQLQLSLDDNVSPLQQIDQSRPIRANIRLTGLDQYGQPIAFPEVMLTATANPSTTQVTLNPQHLSSTQPESALIELVVMFPEIINTTITVAIANPGPGITANDLVVRTLPDTRPPFGPLLEANINAPNRVVQQMFGEALSIPVSVEIVGLQGDQSDLDGLRARFQISVFRYVLTDFGSVQEVFVGFYPLSFVNNQLQTTVVVNLSEEGQDERVRVTFRLAEFLRAIGVRVQEATVTLTAAPESLGLLTVDAPEDVLQSSPDEVLSFTVTVFATGTLGSAFNPEGLSLQAVAGANTTLTEVSYALDFAGGEAQTTVTAELLTQGVNGLVELSVMSGDVAAQRMVSLIAVPETLEQLTITVPAVVTQTVPASDLEVLVSVEAHSNYGRAFNPAGLQLQVLPASNSIITTNTYSLNFVGGVATATVTVDLDTQGLDGSVVLLVVSEKTTLPKVVLLQAVELLGSLVVDAPSVVVQQLPGAELSFTVRILATGTQGSAFNPEGLSLQAVAGANTDLTEASYALNFVEGIAQTTVAVSLITRGNTGSIELSVIGGEINATASVFINPAPAPPILASITLAAASSLVQTAANTPVAAVLMLSALDNYGDPIEAARIGLQIEASNDAIVPSSWTVVIGTSGTGQQMIEILPQNDLDTTVTVSILRGTLDEALQLLPDGGIQISVRALRVLRHLQLSLVNQVSPLRQIDRTLPIRANIRLIGLDQYDQPIAFPEVMLTAAAEPSTTQVTLSPQQLSTTDPEGAQTQLKVIFPDLSPMNTTITITIADPGTDVTVNELVVRALPDLRPNFFAMLLEVNINAPNRVVQQMFGEALSIPVNVEIVPLPGDLQSLLDRFEISVFRYVLTDFSSVQEVFVGFYPLSFVNNQLQTTVVVNLSEEGQDERVRVTFRLAESFRDLGVSVQEATVTLTAAPESLGLLTIDAPEDVLQSGPDDVLSFAVTVFATGTLGSTFNPEGLSLLVEDSGNAEVSQSNYALNFVDGLATTTITVGLTRRGDVGSIELSVVSGDIQTTVSITLNPAPRILASITLSAASSSLVQMMANTPVAAELILTALDNYGNPIGADNVILQLSANSGAIVQTTLTVAIETSGTTRQTVEVLLQNDLDTTLTVQLSRGTLDEAVQLLPDGGIQIAVRALRVLRQLQLSLVDEQSPLQQIDPSLPIRANIRLIGLDQYGQPIAFPAVLLTAAAEPSTTQVTLNPPQLSATDLQGAVTELRVVFPDDNPMDTTITIAIADPSTGITANDLVVRTLPDTRSSFDPLLEANINAPNRVVQQMFGEALSIPVSVEIVVSQGDQSDLDELRDRFEISVFRYVLTDFGSVQEVFVGFYPLSFVNNQLQTTVVVNLSEEGQDERVRVTFRYAEILRAFGTRVQEATVTLTAAPESLGLLTVDAPEDVLQSGPDDVLSFAVTVFATGTLGSAFNPEGLSLQAVAGANTTLTEVSYALDFAGGEARTTVTAELLTQGVNGLVELSVVSGDVAAQSTVSLIAVPETLEQLTITVPAVVTQTVPASDLEVLVSVVAYSNYGRAINPAGLQLQVLPASNSIITTNTYSLNFAGGVATTTVAVGLETQGLDGSVVLLVISEKTTLPKVVLLQAVELLGSLVVDAPSVVVQQLPGAELSFTVRILATGTLGSTFNPEGLSLQAVAGANTTLTEVSYALDFAGGEARTTVTAELLTQGVNGLVELSVMSGDVAAQSTVSLIAVPETLEQLTITVPAVVTQTVTASDLEVLVSVEARSNYGRAFSPAGLQLELQVGANTAVAQSVYAVNFVNGVFQTMVTLSLLEQGFNGSVELLVSSGTVTDRVSVTLRAVELLASLMIDAPESVVQEMLGNDLTTVVRVLATGTLGNAFNPEGVTLQVLPASNSITAINTYSLNFVGGVATTTVTVGLDTQGLDGSVVLLVNSEKTTPPKVVLLQAVELLGSLVVDAPAVVLQQLPGAELSFMVRILATGTQGSVFNPEGLSLQAVAGANTTLTEVSYALDFAGGVAQTTVTAGLLTQGVNGLVELSVMSGDVAAQSTVSLIAVPETLEQLTITVPAVVTQTVTASDLEVLVRVEARSNYGRAFNPAGLQLELQVGANTAVAQSVYAVNFVNGVFQTMVTLSLLEQGFNGSVELLVSSGSVTDRVSVTLRAVELLASLLIDAPESVVQELIGNDLTTVVRVLATGTLGNAFNPEGVTLQVLPASNSIITINTYSLNFVGGVATATVTVGLDTQGLDGSVVLLVNSEKTTPPQVVLLQAVELLGSLVVDAPAVVVQLRPGAELPFMVRILATGTQGSAFDPEGLSLVVAAVSNATAEQELYPLAFTAGEARVTVAADLIDQESNGELLLRVMGGSEAVVHQPVRVELLRALLSSAVLTLDTPNLIQQRIGEAVETTITITVFGNSRQVFPVSGLSLTYSVSTELAAITLSAQQLLFNAPESGVVSSVTVRVSVLPAAAANSTVRFSLAGPILGSAEVAPAVLRITAVVRNLTVVSLSIAAPLVRQLVTDEAVVVTLTVVARDNYQQPIAVAAVELTATVTSGMIVNIPQLSIDESGVLEVGVEVMLSDNRDSRVTIQLLRGDLDESVTLLPSAGVAAKIEGLPVLRKMLLRLLTPVKDLKQIDMRLPVQFKVRIRGLDQNGRAIGAERLDLQVEVDPSSAHFTLDSEVAGFTKAGVSVRVFVLPVQAMDTTATLRATDLDTNVASVLLTVPVQADNRAPIEPIDLTGDEVVSAKDLIFAHRWVNNSRPTHVTEDLVPNLALTTSQITVDGYSHLQDMFAVDSDRGDFNKDGRVDQMDTRIILRYLSGSMLDEDIDVNLLRLFLGQEIQLPPGLMSDDDQ